MFTIERHTEAVRNRAIELGFDLCGFSKAKRLTQEERRLEEWLNQDRHGTMNWMENHFDKRVDPTKLVSGSKTVISLVHTYLWESAKREHQNCDNRPKISKYAMAEDYHFVLKEKLFELYAFIEELNGGCEGRVFTDSAPVLDKAWAAQSGLGWMGKNSNILNKKLGSFFFLGEIILNVEFVYDHPTTDHCGSCTRCIDACPTDAIYEPYRVDGSKCISYLTIELRDKIPEHFHAQMGEWIYGCDICQDVCPWNSKAPFSHEERYKPRENLLNKPLDFWEELNIEEYRELFRKSAVKRTKFTGLKRNIDIVSKNLKSSTQG